MKNKGYVYRDRVCAADEGRGVLDFYSRRYPHSHREEWRARIAAGEVRLNGGPAGSEARLKAGDRLAWHRPPWEEPDAPGEFAALTEEDSFLVVDKPAGLPVLPGAGFMENTLLHRVRERFGPGCNPLHRLGRWTSGAVLFARTRDAARSLGRAMQARRFSKTYLALASGTDLPDRLHITIPIGPVVYPPLGTLHAACENGMPAESLVEVLHRQPDRNITLVRVRITTGRPHQIRIHLAAAGYPLMGDPLYGVEGRPRPGGALPGDPGYRLHAWKLGFPHPRTGKMVDVESPVPEWALPLSDCF